MTTLLHTSEGAVPMHTAVETEAEREAYDAAYWAEWEKIERWEALRSRATTIGARAALDEAMRELERRPA